MNININKLIEHTKETVSNCQKYEKTNVNLTFEMFNEFLQALEQQQTKIIELEVNNERYNFLRDTLLFDESGSDWHELGHKSDELFDNYIDEFLPKPPEDKSC